MENDGQEVIDGAAGAPEGAVTAAPTTDQVAEMYKNLGIKTAAPTGATKGRPKSSSVRAEDVSTEGDENSESGRQDDKQSQVKSKNAPTDDENGASGDDSDAAGKKVGQDSGQVPDKSKEADGGVRKTKSATEKDSERGSQDDSDQGDDGAKDGDKSEESEEGKRPGKSNPKTEQRFQKLSSDVRERDELIEKLRGELQDNTTKQQAAQLDQDDPKYTIDDFRKVRDEYGEVLDLDDNQAELAWRRWQDGYNQRSSEREAQHNHEAAAEKSQQESSEQMMRSSVAAYDTLTGILDSYPELNSQNQEFDQEFSDVVLPIIKEAIIYQQGTEPGNAEGLKSVVIGLRMNPNKMLTAMNAIKKSKRSLPLNGANDNVESRSNVNVSHSRSSDPTVKAANELMKELNINKRF